MPELNTKLNKRTEIMNTENNNQESTEQALTIPVVSSRSIEFGKWLNSECNIGRGLPMDSWLHPELGKVDTKEAYRYFCELNGY